MGAPKGGGEAHRVPTQKTSQNLVIKKCNKARNRGPNPQIFSQPQIMPSKFFENNVNSRAVYYILKTIAETNSKIYLCQKMN